jgi:hypothetical protein
LLFAIGHTLGLRQTNPKWGVGFVIDSMRSIHFDAQGLNRTCWDFLARSGFLSHYHDVFDCRGMACSEEANQRPAGLTSPGIALHIASNAKLPQMMIEMFVH